MGRSILQAPELKSGIRRMILDTYPSGLRIWSFDYLASLLLVILNVLVFFSSVCSGQEGVILRKFSAAFCNHCDSRSSY